jgi:hypothetical protein
MPKERHTKDDRVWTPVHRPVVSFERTKRGLVWHFMDGPNKM